ncbi:MAG: ABC-type transport system, substrate-binding component [Herbinix sp.]|nr:ABC-type transport system, substrate-binding component [Herbinix sp.]
MLLSKKKLALLLILVAVSVGAVSVNLVKAAYLATNRDTKLPPDKVSYDITAYDEFEKIYETDTLEYYYREDRDLFAIKDKRSGYTWKTGLDIPFGADIQQQILDAATKEEAEKLAIPLEEGMNSTYTAISNSILTVEYNEDGTTKNISSASKDLVESQLVTLNDNPATRRLDVDFQSIEVEVKVYITFQEDGIQYEIKNEDITGKGIKDVMAFIITPFLGASGGKTKYYNTETEMYDIIKDKYMIPGYIFVPDGSGSLLRFQNNSASFSLYTGDVYGADPSQNTYYNNMLSDAIPLKDPVMPVFGVTHGDGQAAFVAYADQGAEYMQIVVRPEENLTAYNYVYPRFVYNVNYYQVYNKKGDGYFTLMEQPNGLNIKLTYTFLAGNGSDGTPAADYTGMAATYRKHLMEEGILTEMGSTGEGDIPIRLDFIMSDSKKGIVGTDEVVATTAEDVGDILETIRTESGITNINSGLYGWQQGGETLAKPDSANYYRKIGSQSDFKKLITEFNEKNIDISYARDYSTINEEMLNYHNTAARHVNSWYLELNKMYILPANVPVWLFGYATPQKSAAWLQKQLGRVASYSDSMTVGGMSNTLLSNYDSSGITMTATEVISLYQETFAKAKEKVKLNMESPNMYLWKYTDRYLLSPVGTSQYVFETDAVPFLQMVLNGTMEVYAPYSNFSFYTQTDILRMIDYNLSPSFILSKEPSHLLAATPSADLYSTEFEQYEDLISQVYSQVNGVLSKVQGFTWAGRRVPQNGVIINTYSKGEEHREIIINYTQDDFSYGTTTVAPLSAALISAEEVQ